MLGYCTTAAALGAGWFVVLFGGLANLHDTLSLYVMGLTATAISFYVVIPYDLACSTS